MSYDSWKTTDTSLEYAHNIERLIDDEVSESDYFINIAYDKTFGSIKFADLTMEQIDKYLCKGVNILFDNEYLSFDDLEEITDKNEYMYILFLVGFNNLVVDLCDVDISLYIKCSLLADNDVAQEVEKIIEQRQSNI